MANKRQRSVRAAARVPSLPNVQAAQMIFGGTTGRWATSMLKAAALEGKALSASVLRTLDTLRHEEWKYFDDALLMEAVIRLTGVSDLIAAGNVINVPNALGKTVLGYEKATDLSPASTTLDGLARGMNERQEFSLNQMPLPITHKDFNINLRTLTASREKGESLDTIQVRTAGRVVSEQLEKMLFQGGPTFGGLPIYGYTTEPNRNTGGFVAHGDWAQAAKTGPDILADVLKMLTGLQADRMYGPYMIYIPGDAGVAINGDYVPTGATASSGTIRQRIEAIEGIAGVRVADQMPAATVVMVQTTPDVASWVNGESLQTVQWDENGGFELNFKAFCIGVPLIRADVQGRSGVYHMS